ncbi:hypothetical protein M8C21_001960 [Ambrosia artemisiifolia]|uniref:Uncharacterized protein n=1 Tax=Ambrosia artemisiifolia TaxID=4212 RepID=A0AAD5GKA4_AMBAR|nr:hypothetical protein M8C21_001960 [Ambrosia artemisiifolia]
MDNKIATLITFFTLLLILYTVSAARPTKLDQPITNPTAVRTDDASKLPKISHKYVASTGRSKIVLPGENVTLDKPTNDLKPRTNFSRFHPINRHFQVGPHRQSKPSRAHRRPCLKHKQYKIPFTKMEASKKKDEVVVESTDVPKLNNENPVRPKTFRGEVPANWLKVKHHYGSRQQHNNQNHDNQANKKEESVKKMKNVFDQEKMKSLRHQQQLKKSEDHKAGLMKDIRKFLKHTFD